MSIRDVPDRRVNYLEECAGTFETRNLLVTFENGMRLAAWPGRGSSILTAAFSP